MSFQVRYDYRAEDDYRREFEWSVRHWGKSHAVGFFSRVRATIDRLAQFPTSYPQPIGAKGDYRVINLPGLRVAYHVNEVENVVTILAIVGKNHFHELEQKALKVLGK